MQGRVTLQSQLQAQALAGAPVTVTAGTAPPLPLLLQLALQSPTGDRAQAGRTQAVTPKDAGRTRGRAPLPQGLAAEREGEVTGHAEARGARARNTEPPTHPSPAHGSCPALPRHGGCRGHTNAGTHGACQGPSPEGPCLCNPRHSGTDGDICCPPPGRSKEETQPCHQG